MGTRQTHNVESQTVLLHAKAPSSTHSGRRNRRFENPYNSIRNVIVNIRTLASSGCLFLLAQLKKWLHKSMWRVFVWTGNQKGWRAFHCT
jgi:hypothetical protein